MRRCDPASGTHHASRAAAHKEPRTPSHGLLSPGQSLSATNAAPTRYEKGELGKTARRGAFAHTSTERTKGPSHTLQVTTGRHRGSRADPSERQARRWCGSAQRATSCARRHGQSGVKRAEPHAPSCGSRGRASASATRWDRKRDQGRRTEARSKSERSYRRTLALARECGADTESQSRYYTPRNRGAECRIRATTLPTDPSRQTPDT